MRQGLIVGLHKRRKKGTTRRDPTASPSDDLVNRAFDFVAANRLWLTDITEHRTDEGRVYLAAVAGALSRRVIGWSIADHIRAELVVDALQMAIPNDHPTVVHSDTARNTRRGRSANAYALLGSMGTIGDAYDNAAA